MNHGAKRVRPLDRMELRTAHPRRTLLTLTNEWQTARELAEIAGIPVNGAGTALLALHARAHRTPRRRPQLRLAMGRPRRQRPPVYSLGSNACPHAST
jgi:hypothetical protein